MTAEWIPRIHIHHKNKPIATVELPAVRSDVIPRIGEYVGFPKSEICEALHLQHLPSHVPVVLAVHHDVTDAGTNVWVGIRMDSVYDAEQTRRYARNGGIIWYETPAVGD